MGMPVRNSVGNFTSPDDYAARTGLMKNLRAVVEKDPYNAQAAYEAGWLALIGDQRHVAGLWFMHAIWADPDLAAAWYGLGFVTFDDDMETGAFAIGEVLSGNAEAARRMRDQFPARLSNANSGQSLVERQAKASRDRRDTQGGITSTESVGGDLVRMSVTAGGSVWTSDRRQPMQRKLVLGRLLKSGGSGSVYLMPESPLQVAKIYHDRVNRVESEQKVAAMLELSPRLPDIVESAVDATCRSRGPRRCCATIRVASSVS